ncbi:MAG TPA: hypothetical protein VFG69_07390 [Nannocystaceae bacterium]|nr:hypothetical protein [Nannocystaceae bacterium]
MVIARCLVAIAIVGGGLGCESATRRHDTVVPAEPTHDAMGVRWWTATPPCPAGSTLAGTAPPEGDLVWCEKDGLQHGPATSFYPDGSRRSDATYVDGELEGAWKQYFHGGKPRTAGTFAKGKETGTWRVWFASGGLSTERTYLADADGEGATTVRVREFRPGGRKLREGTLVDGAKHGRWVEYTDKGEALRQVWDHGRRVSGVDWHVGVKECDEYVAKYTKCVEAQKDPTQREQFRESLRWTVQSWRDALAQGGKPTDIAAQCKAASTAMKQSAASMGCAW